MAGLDRGWQVRKSLAGCNSYMLENNLACDIKIQFRPRNGVVVEQLAHKYMLVSRSPVFEAMLCGSYQESSDCIQITDIEPGPFKEVLRYMYCDEANLTVDNVLHVMFAAKKYFIEGLVDKAKHFLEENMDENNVCTILTNCLFYMDTDLSTKCLDYIIKYSEAVFSSDDLLNLSQDALCLVLQNDDVRLKTESEMFRCCVTWAKHQVDEINIAEEKLPGKLREALGKCLFQIRFHAMSSKEFAECVGKSGVLTSEEMVAIFCQIATSKETEQLSTMGFNVSSRNKRLDDFPQWRRFRDCGRDDVRWHYEGELDSIAFKTDKQVLIHGICVYGGYFKGDQHKAEVKLFDAGNDKWVAKVTKEISSDGTDTPIPIFFDEPIRLVKDLWHAVALKMSGPDTFFGEVGLDSLCIDGVNLDFSDHVDDVNGTDVYNGQIPMIVLMKDDT